MWDQVMGKKIVAMGMGTTAKKRKDSKALATAVASLGTRKQSGGRRWLMSSMEQAAKKVQLLVFQVAIMLNVCCVPRQNLC